MMDRVLGIDGGGTKTDVAVADRSGRVVRRLRAEGLDPVGGQDWEAVLRGIAAEVGPVAQAVLGLPFHGEIAAVSDAQRSAAARIFGPGTLVLNDVEIAFDGALGGEEGVLVLAGTGSMAWARGPLGTHRVGGWGEMFGDEGSAYWIGREALAWMSQELDGRRDGALATALLPRMGIASGSLSAWAYGLDDPRAPRARIAGLAQEVSALARAGQPEAVALMAAAAGQLAQQGMTAARLCGTSGRWSFAGGVMADPVVRQALTDRMGVAPVPPVLPPVGGAVLRAARAAGWLAEAAFVAALAGELTKTANRPDAGQTPG